MPTSTSDDTYSSLHDPDSLQNKNFAVTLRHKKCGLVRKVKKQIENAEGKWGIFSTCYGCCRNKLFGCWRNSFCCIAIIMTVLSLSWACIVYGIMIGATACSQDGYGYKPFIPLFKIPGLKWQQNIDSGKLYKVF